MWVRRRGPPRLRGFAAAGRECGRRDETANPRYEADRIWGEGRPRPPGVESLKRASLRPPSERPGEHFGSATAAERAGGPQKAYTNCRKRCEGKSAGVRWSRR